MAAQDAAVLSRRAAQLMQSGQPREAAKLYESLIKQFPSNAGLQMNLGMARFQAAEHAHAIPPLERATKLDVKLTPAWLVLGLAHWKLNQPGKAIPPLERALQLDPNNSVARIELADAFLATNQHTRAIEHFSILTANNPGHAKGWHGLVLGYSALSRAAFEQIDKLAPESAYWYALLGRSRLDQEQYRSAFYFFKKALEKQPNLRVAHLALASIYRNTGHAEWAMVEEQRAAAVGAEACCDEPAKLYRQAIDYSTRSSEALEHLEALPPGPEILELLARAHTLRGEHRRAAEILATTTEPRLQLEHARALWRALDCAAATPSLETLGAAFSNHASWNHMRGDCLLQQQLAEQSLPFLEKAARLDPKLLPARASLARAYQRLGNDRDAIPHFEAALEIDEDGSLHLQLSRAFDKAGLKEKAAIMRAAFQKIASTNRERARRASQDFQISPPQ